MTPFVPRQPDHATLITDAADALRSGEFCDDILSFHALWSLKRKARIAPSRSDFDPVEMPQYLAGITLIDIVDDERRFAYRLIGTREVAMRDNDPTGKGVGEGFFAPTADAALAAYQDVVDRRGPRFERRHFITPDGRIGNEQSVVLPLSADGSGVNMIIAYTHHFLA